MILLVSGMMGLTLAPATHAAITLTPEEEVLMEKEPALNQADLEVFLEYLPRLMEAGEAADEAPVLEIIKETGWSKIKVASYASKVSLGYTCLEDPDGYNEFKALGFMPEAYFPTAEEIDLVKQNKSKVEAIFKK